METAETARGQLLFRDMDVDEDGTPVVGPFNWTLGVRTEGKPYDVAVVEVNGEKYVEPTPDRPQGMSVAPDDPINLHPRHRPPELGGTGRYPVWSIWVQTCDFAGRVRPMALSSRQPACRYAHTRRR